MLQANVGVQQSQWRARLSYTERNNLIKNSDFSAKDFSLPDPINGEVIFALYKNKPFASETPLSLIKGLNKKKTRMDIFLDKEDSYTQQLKIIDEYMIDYGIKHSRIIFGKEYTQAQRSIVESFYYSVLKGQQDVYFHPGTGAIKFHDEEHYISPKIMFDSTTTSRRSGNLRHAPPSQEVLDSFDHFISSIQKDNKVNLVINFTPWFLAGKFGLNSWVLQIRARKIDTPNKLSGDSFLDEPL